ncbi:hypothetical protein MHYP_G00232990 [Metynnis hypsauchen]
MRITEAALTHLWLYPHSTWPKLPLLSGVAGRVIRSPRANRFAFVRSGAPEKAVRQSGLRPKLTRSLPYALPRAYVWEVDRATIKRTSFQDAE